ncbi:MAG: DUF4124 domain-containing protein [Gammaproteobacteria bacterium]
MNKAILTIALCLSFNSWAGVYKCKDSEGRSYYQSLPCSVEDQAVKINPKTGTQVDLDALKQKEAYAAEEKKAEETQKLAEEKARLEAIDRRKQLAKTEAELTQTLIKQNPTQFSAFAVPPYDPDNLPTSVKPFEERLPDIEKFRRLAAQKALATGDCQRVEADELNTRSRREQLVFLVNCSSGTTYYYNEAELAE